MLVLSRKPGQVVIIGKDVRLTILGVRGKQVRLGFAAPAEVPIRRDELAPRLRAKRK